MSPGAKAYGDVKTGKKTGLAKFTFKNNTGGSVVVGAASLTGPNADQFIAPVANNGCTGQTLAAGQTCIVRVQFAPTSVGRRGGAVAGQRRGRPGADRGTSTGTGI